jgi:hypothetical protein
MSIGRDERSITHRKARTPKNERRASGFLICTYHYNGSFDPLYCFGQFRRDAAARAKTELYTDQAKQCDSTAQN